MKRITHKRKLSPATQMLVPLLVSVVLPQWCWANELQEFSDDMLEFILNTDVEVLQAIEHRPLLDVIGDGVLQQGYSLQSQNRGEPPANHQAAGSGKNIEVGEGVQAQTVERVQ